MRRTRRFAAVPRTVAGIDAFKASIEGTEPRKRPFPDFHHCAFLGMIEDAGRRVGCLLHPLARGNGGVDWRGLSYYGGMACRTYFCPSVRHLPVRWLTAVRQSMDHWYLHGLVVTERRLLAALFTRTGKPDGPGDRYRRLFRACSCGRAVEDADHPETELALPPPGCTGRMQLFLRRRALSTSGGEQKNQNHPRIPLRRTVSGTRLRVFIRRSYQTMPKQRSRVFWLHWR